MVGRGINVGSLLIGFFFFSFFPSAIKTVEEHSSYKPSKDLFTSSKQITLTDQIPSTIRQNFRTYKGREKSGYVKQTTIYILVYINKKAIETTSSLSLSKSNYITVDKVNQIIQ